MRGRRTDANHQTIAGYFERLGCLVHHAICPGYDLVVSKFGAVALIEIKDPAKPPSARKLTPTSQKMLDEGWPVKQVMTLDHVMAVVEELRKQGMRRDL